MDKTFEEQVLLTDSKHASKLEAEFAEVLAPLEAEAQARLKGWGRKKCLAAFTAHPDAFRNCANEALERGRNPIGLLVQMVSDSDCDAPAPAAPMRLDRGHGICVNCGGEAEDSHFLRGQWWCSECEPHGPAS